MKEAYYTICASYPHYYHCNITEDGEPTRAGGFFDSYGEMILYLEALGVSLVYRY